MRTLFLSLAAISLAIPAATVIPAASAQTHTTKKHSSRTHHYHHPRRCRHSSGTTGLVAGGVGGALVGNSVLGHGVLGTVGGAVGGAFAGRAIDRTITAKDRCR